ncbi:MAG: hypothetical protein ACK5MR_18230 [Cumulibacter sp.]
MTSYIALVAAAARLVASSVDVVVLAQASMADALALLKDASAPVLASPQLAVDTAIAWHDEQFDETPLVGRDDNEPPPAPSTRFDDQWLERPGAIAADMLGYSFGPPNDMASRRPNLSATTGH